MCVLVQTLSYTLYHFQAYDWGKDDPKVVKMPITSYMTKTAVFYLLAHTSSSQLEMEINKDDRAESKASIDALKNALDRVADKQKMKRNKLQFRPDNPPLAKWLTKQDLQEHGEEARVWAEKIFSLIKYLAERDWKLNSYWIRSYPVLAIMDEDRTGFGEAEYICDVCDCALLKLKRDTFFA